MKIINIEGFIKSLTEENIKGRIYTIDEVSKDENKLVTSIFYRIDSNTFLQLTAFDIILKLNYYFNKKAIKELGAIRNLSWVEFNKAMNKCYKTHDMIKYVVVNYNEEKSRTFFPFSNYNNEGKLEKFNSITDVSDFDKDYKHVSYRGESVYAKILKVSSGGSIKCKLFDYETLNHIGYTNLNNLNG